MSSLLDTGRGQERPEYRDFTRWGFWGRLEELLVIMSMCYGLLGPTYKCNLLDVVGCGVPSLITVQSWFDF